MRQCAGLPPQPPLRREDPRLLFINRRHSGVPSSLFFLHTLTMLSAGPSNPCKCSGAQCPDNGRSIQLLQDQSCRA